MTASIKTVSKWLLDNVGNDAEAEIFQRFLKTNNINGWGTKKLASAYDSMRAEMSKLNKINEAPFQDLAREHEAGRRRIFNKYAGIADIPDEAVRNEAYVARGKEFAKLEEDFKRKIAVKSEPKEYTPKPKPNRQQLNTESVQTDIPAQSQKPTHTATAEPTKPVEETKPVADTPKPVEAAPIVEAKPTATETVKTVEAPKQQVTPKVAPVPEAKTEAPVKAPVNQKTEAVKGKPTNSEYQGVKTAFTDIAKFDGSKPTLNTVNLDKDNMELFPTDYAEKNLTESLYRRRDRFKRRTIYNVKNAPKNALKAIAGYGATTMLVGTGLLLMDGTFNSNPSGPKSNSELFNPYTRWNEAYYPMGNPNRPQPFEAMPIVDIPEFYTMGQQPSDMHTLYKPVR